jgi:hypothetical protein
MAPGGRLAASQVSVASFGTCRMPISAPATLWEEDPKKNRGHARLEGQSNVLR